MTPKKLSDSEKQEIASSYTGGGVTMASLARTFGVSASTISRILRQAEAQKPEKKAATPIEANVVTLVSEPAVASETRDDSQPLIKRKRRSRSSGSKAQTTSEEIPQETLSSSSEAIEIAPSSNSSSPAASKDQEIQAKRTRKRTTTRTAITTNPDTPIETAPETDISSAPNVTELSESEEASTEQPQRRVRRRSSAHSSEESVTISGDEAEDETDTMSEEDSSDLEVDLSDEDLDEEDSLDDDYGDDDEEDEEDEDYEDGDEDDSVDTDPDQPLQVFPFAGISLPNPCYLVVDRSAELITRPLKEFRDLGVIPDSEADLKTLPIFDNHRIARRFSARNQRVIKVPDSTVFLKTGPHLQAKKIVRLLIDGRVYAL